MHAPLSSGRGILFFRRIGMNTTFLNSARYLFTSESVTEGHPDKLCDQVSDAVLDECLRQDPRSRVACETATKTGFVMVLGEITTNAFVNFDDLVRKVVKDIGYDNTDKGFDGNTCAVLASICAQSGDIAMGVDKSLEAKAGEITEAEVENALIIGTPEQCAEHLKRYEALGIHNMQMNMNFGANHRDVLRSQELFATRVMPHFA